MSQTTNVARAPKSLGILRDPENDWALNQTLGFMTEQAAEIGECLYAARRINEEDPEAWITEWASLAARVEALGDESLTRGHPVSARESLLRASNYWRTAEYGCPPSHPRFTELWNRSVQAFQKACTLLKPEIQRLEVPFEGKKLPAYYIRPEGSEEVRPTFFAVGGNDSSLEQMTMALGFAAARRGYNFFTWDYPGHRGAVHLYPDAVKRSDYSVPFRAAFDFLEKLPGVDGRFALAGYSYGGYVVSQVAAHEERVTALVPDSPIIDFPAVQRSSLMNALTKLIPDGMLDRMVESQLRRKCVARGLIYYTLWTWGCPSFHEWRHWKPKLDNVIIDDLSSIKCPALALVSAHEGEIMVRQAETFMEKISSRVKRLHKFTLEEDGSYDHCQLDNHSRGGQVIFDWLDEVLHRSST